MKTLFEQEEPVDPAKPTEPKVGDLVSYYLEGWRTGWLDSVKGKVCVIRPIVPKGAKKPRVVRVPSSDVQVVNKETRK